MAVKVPSPAEKAQAEEERSLVELSQLTAEPVGIPLSDGTTVMVHPIKGRQIAAYARAMQPIRKQQHALQLERDREEMEYMATQSQAFSDGARACSISLLSDNPDKQPPVPDGLAGDEAEEWQAGWSWRRLRDIGQEDEFLTLLADSETQVFEAIRICTNLDEERLNNLDAGDLLILYGTACRVNADFFHRRTVAALARCAQAGVELDASKRGPQPSSTFANTGTGQ